MDQPTVFFKACFQKSVNKVQKKLKQFRDQYVVGQAQNAELPEFEPSILCRYGIRFSGRVQNVGFRLEVAELAKNLGLTGYCENLPDGDVYAELQGPQNRILYLVSFLESLVRIRITDKKIEKLPLLEEVGFRIK